MPLFVAFISLSLISLLIWILFCFLLYLCILPVYLYPWCLLCISLCFSNTSVCWKYICHWYLFYSVYICSVYLCMLPVYLCLWCLCYFVYLVVSLYMSVWCLYICPLLSLLLSISLCFSVYIACISVSLISLLLRIYLFPVYIWILVYLYPCIISCVSPYPFVSVLGLNL